ncbi:hypothetical protein ACFL57_00075 [Candidatus Margulisiibacteriota bacterium]
MLKQKEKDRIVEIFNNILSCFGPKELLKEDGKKRIYHYTDSINGHLFDTYQYETELIEFIKKIIPTSNYNEESLWIFVPSLVKSTISKIISIYPNITSNLNSYICPDIKSFLFSSINSELKKFDNSFRVIIITNLIKLEGVPEIQIGPSKIVTIDNNFLDNFPDKIPTYNDNLGLLRTESFSYTDKAKAEFLKIHKDKVAIIINDINGYHFKNEKSYIYHEALKKLQLIYSFLEYCNTFTHDKSQCDNYCRAAVYNNIKPHTDFYLTNNKHFDFITVVQEKKHDINDRYFYTINNEILLFLNKACILESFNQLFKPSKQKADIQKTNQKVLTAFEWYLKGLQSDDYTDQMLSFFISIEALLSYGRMELRNTLSENVAILMGNNVEDRYKCKKDFNKIYDTRCRIVHEGAQLTKNDIRLIAELKVTVAFCLRGILCRLPEIYKSNIKEYFEKLKLKG